MYNSKMKDEKDFNSHNGYFENFANSINAKFNLDVKEIGSCMNDEAIMSIEAVRKALLEKEGVAVVPGIGFGAEGYFRFSFATDLDSIKKGIARIANFCQS